MRNAYDKIIDALRNQGSTVIDTGRGKATAQCPAHDDGHASLSVTHIEGSALIYCHAGCDTHTVLGAVGLRTADLFDNPRGGRYEYPDGRTVHRSPDKRFRQSGNTKGNQLFRADRIGKSETVHVVEGEKDVLAIESVGGAAVCSAMGAGKADKFDWTPLRGKSVVVVADKDEPGRKHATQVADQLAGIAATMQIVEAGEGKDAADHIAAGLGIDQFVPVMEPDSAQVPPMTLADAHGVFRNWLGDDYDTDALNAVLATAAVERLDGDPLWLLLISGSGNAKTETVQSLSGIDALVVSTISSEGALLSATSKKEIARDATGGLLREIGERGILVVKDVTSILSANSTISATVLAALREVYDGRWVRQVGTDGGRSLPWSGRIAVVGAVTTAWDTAHSAISSMGDRFVLVRMDSTKGRQKAGRQAIGNTGSETVMRAELAAAAAGVIAGMNTSPITVTDEETDILLAAADLVTRARTGVEYNFRGDVVDAHAPEMPTRFAKQLSQIVRGGVAIGMDRDDALRLAIRCARDSMPPLRLAIIDDLSKNPGSTTTDVRKRIGKPRTTVDRQLQALDMLDVLDCTEEERPERSRWFYSLADGIDPEALNPGLVPDFSVGAGRGDHPPEHAFSCAYAHSEKSGTNSVACSTVGCETELVNPESIERGWCDECDWERTDTGLREVLGLPDIMAVALRVSPDSTEPDTYRVGIRRSYMGDDWATPVAPDAMEWLGDNVHSFGLKWCMWYHGTVCGGDATCTGKCSATLLNPTQQGSVMSVRIEDMDAFRAIWVPQEIAWAKSWKEAHPTAVLAGVGPKCGGARE